jgi:hypothetical protein
LGGVQHPPGDPAKQLFAQPPVTESAHQAISGAMRAS